MVIKTIHKNGGRSVASHVHTWREHSSRLCATGPCWNGCNPRDRSAKDGGKSHVVGKVMQIFGGGYQSQAAFPMSKGLYQAQNKAPTKIAGDLGETVGLTITNLAERPAKIGVLKCASIEHWLDAECTDHPGMVTERAQTWDDVQFLADQLHAATAFGEDEEVIEKVDTSSFQNCVDLAASLYESADRLVAPMLAYGLQESFEQQIRRDVVEIGSTVAKLLPSSKLNISLRLMKENSCARWHQDNYAARAICTYNSHGTECIHSDYVNFWELNNCGKNDHVIKDATKVQAIGVGDVLLIKGKKFVGKAAGLVHRSPPFHYHPNGEIKTRLCLKVDVM